ncbi:hypothetical protein BB561_005361 [Smittium simulii]|uniref:Uncharacterized protein n=1 Tax=Smittium simulii TaxID=133385 RepID=A0A2T9YAQ8_9FUNG|nr:hypothetical protein BB561_005361 [Smittium simulii]
MKIVFAILAAVVTAWPVLENEDKLYGIPDNYDIVTKAATPGILTAFEKMTVAAKDKISGANFVFVPSEVPFYSNVSVVAYSVDTGKLITNIGAVNMSFYDFLGNKKGGVLTAGIPADKVTELYEKTNQTAARITMLAKLSNETEPTKWAGDSYIMAFV